MKNEFLKEIGLLSIEKYHKLVDTTIVLFGLGGVGGYVFEGLIRAGIEKFVLIDKDKFDITNINRQRASSIKSIDKYKVDVYKDIAHEINNDSEIITINKDINNENLIETISPYITSDNIYFIDCIDDIDAKIAIIKYCNEKKYKLISSMGTANHISSENIKIADISNTRYCPVAKIIRKKLKDEHINNLACLYIDEEPIKHDKPYLSTISYIPSICGLKIAEYVIKTI